MDPSPGQILCARKGQRPSKQSKPEILRHELRTILLDSIGKEPVRWESRCTKVEAPCDGMMFIFKELSLSVASTVS